MAWVGFKIKSYFNFLIAGKATYKSAVCCGNWWHREHINNKNVFDLTESWTFAFLMQQAKHINMLKIVVVIPLAWVSAAAA